MKSQSKKEVTFLWIPDASRPVQLFNVKKRVVRICCLFILIICLSAIFYHLGKEQHHKHTIEQLLQQLSEESQLRLKTLTNKNDYILQLKTQILELSEQAEVVQKQLEQLRSLEEELLNLTSATSLQTREKEKSREVSIASSQTKPSVGGEWIEPEPAQWDRLAANTNETLQNLRIEIANLTIQFSEIKKDVIAEQRQLRYTPSIWPVHSRQITSGYGIRRDPFTRNASFHSGIDIAGKHGDPIFAAADGTVITAKRDPHKGNHIYIRHDYGWDTQYMHLSQIFVEQWETIKKGDKIGAMGSTGRSTGTHLHYEVWKNGRTVNPSTYLPR